LLLNEACPETPHIRAIERRESPAPRGDSYPTNRRQRLTAGPIVGVGGKDNRSWSSSFSEAPAGLIFERSGFRELAGGAGVGMIRAHGALQIVQRRPECGASFLGFRLCLESAAQGEIGGAQLARNFSLLNCSLQERHSPGSIGYRPIRALGFQLNC